LSYAPAANGEVGMNFDYTICFEHHCAADYRVLRFNRLLQTAAGPESSLLLRSCKSTLRVAAKLKLCASLRNRRATF